MYFEWEELENRKGRVREVTSGDTWDFDTVEEAKEHAEANNIQFQQTAREMRRQIAVTEPDND